MVLTMKLSIFKNKRTSHSEILIKVYKYNETRFQEPKIFKHPVDDSSLSGIIHHTGSLVLKWFLIKGCNVSTVFGGLRGDFLS